MRAWLRENSLSLFFLVLFLATLVGQSIAGHLEYNGELSAHGDPSISWGRYVVSSHFGGAVMENWQSEFLQFSFFIAATIWLVQKGSAESKKLDEAGLQTDEQQRVGEHASQRSPRWARVKSWRYKLYSNSLLIVMTAIFFGTLFAQSVTDWTTYNESQRDHHEQAVSWLTYLGSADFWEKTLQNWQSEFLAVGTMAVFTIYLRQRGSPESKPVGAPHDETGSSV
jgi:Domain of unknown function (DUF6766)